MLQKDCCHNTIGPQEKSVLGYIYLYPTRSKSGKTATEKIFNNFIPHFGFPAKLHHDRAVRLKTPSFTPCRSSLGLVAPGLPHTTPQGNTIERLNRTLLQMLWTLTEKDKQSWKEYLPKEIHVYNCTKHESTGYSPFYLMFGRHP